MYSMKKKLLLPILVLVAAAILLAGCATGLTPSSWTGVTATADVAYLAGGPYVYAVNLQTGAELWRFPDKASPTYPFYAPPVLTTDGQLIIGGFDHKLYSINPTTKAQNWVFADAKDRYIGSVLVVGDVVYAPNSDYKLYAVSLKSGSLQWSFTADQSLWATPATDGKNIYFGTLGGRFYSVDAATGKMVWKVTVDNAVLGSPVVKDGVLYITAYSGQLIALDAATGKSLWSQTVAGRIWSGPVLDGDHLYFGDASGGLYAYDLTGALVWQQKLAGAVVGSPSISNGTFFVGTDQGSVYLVSLDGQNIQQVAIKDVGNSKDNSKVYASPVPAGTLILVTPTSGTNFLIALDETGARKWVYNPAK
jgi:outer membrane protein assembly factor BamB